MRTGKLLLLTLVAKAFSFSIDIAVPADVEYPGEEVILPIKITTNEGGAGLSGNVPATEEDYTYHVSSVAAELQWLHAQYGLRCDRSASDNTCGEYHWMDGQDQWIELRGYPPAAGTFSGIVQVCPNVGTCQEMQVNVTVKAASSYPAVVLFQDAAASFGRQSEIYTALSKTSGSSNTLHYPYYDYYLTTTSYTEANETFRRIPNINLWYVRSSYKGCLEVYKCGDGRFRIRTHLNADIPLVTGSLNLTKMGYWEQNSLSNAYPYDIYDKVSLTLGFPVPTMDYSYPERADAYEARGFLRAAQLNATMPLYDGDGTLLWGVPPSWKDACVPATEGVDYLTTTSDKICTAGNPPVFSTPDNQTDEIYTSDDYSFFPAVTSSNGSTVTLTLLNAPDWLEIGTANNYTTDGYWPHTNVDTRQYVRSQYSWTRQTLMMNPGIYSYTIKATDGKGEVAFLRRSIHVLSPSWHPSAPSKRVAAVAGDETWFSAKQMDLVTGLVNLTNQDITLASPYYDYFINWTEADPPLFNTWYLNPGVSVSTSDCGNGHWRIRHSYAGTLSIPTNRSLFDNKVGIFQQGYSRYEKTDDHSYPAPDFYDPVENKSVNVSRKLDFKVVVYSGNGVLEWGDAPSWAASCDVATSSSSSQPPISSSSSQPPISSSSSQSPTGSTSVQFKNYSSSSSELKIGFRIQVPGMAGTTLSGYKLVYFSGMDNLSNNNYTTLAGVGVSASSVYSTSPCTNGMYYKSTITLNSDAVLNSASEVEIYMQLQNSTSGRLEKSLHYSFMDASTYTEDGNVALYDPNGTLVYGSEDPVCLASSSSTELPSGSLSIQFEDNQISNAGNLSAKYQIHWTGSKAVPLKDYTLVYYAGTQSFTQFYDLQFGTHNGYNVWHGVDNNHRSEYLSQTVCDDGTYQVQYFLPDDALVSSDGGYYEFLSQLAFDNGQTIPKASHYSYLAASSLTDNRKVALFNPQGQLVYGSIAPGCRSTMDPSGFHAVKNNGKRFIPQIWTIQQASASQFSLGLEIRNTGAVSHSLSGYHVRYYFENTGLERHTLEQDLSVTASSSSQAFTPNTVMRCSDNHFAIDFTVPAGTTVSGKGTYPSSTAQFTVQSSLAQQDLSFLQNGPSYKPSTSIAATPVMGLFDPSGNLVYGQEPWPCNGYQPPTTDVEVKVADLNAGSDGSYSSSAAGSSASTLHPYVQLKLTNLGRKDLAAGATVNFLFNMEAGLVPVFTSHSSGENVQMTQISSATYLVRWTLASDLNGSPARWGSLSNYRTITFELQDQCALDCEDGDSWLYPWRKDDDYSLLYQNTSGQLVLVPNTEVVTTRVQVMDADGTILYGESEGMPALRLASQSSSSTVLTHGTIQVGTQYPNRTVAIQYAGGTVLTNGTFEKGTLGWSSSSGTMTSILAPEGGIPEGSRYLRSSGKITQQITDYSPAYQLLADSGAVLWAWVKSSGGSSVTMRFAGQSTSMSSLSSSWSKMSLTVTPAQVQAAQANRAALKVEFEGTGFDIDNAVLQPGSTVQPVNLAVRYTSTLHYELETQVSNGVDSVWVSQSERDAIGRPTKKALPFALACSGGSCNTRKTIEGTIRAAQYYNGTLDFDYPDAGGKPYTETSYEPDQTAAVSETGRPGLDFAIGSGHTARTLYSGINLGGMSSFLNPAAWASLLGPDLTLFDGASAPQAAVDNPTHALQVDIDPDGRQSFSVKDPEGLVIAAGIRLPDHTHYAVSVNEYNERGLLKTSHSPMSCGYLGAGADCVDPSAFTYDDEGRMTSRIEPDAGTTKYFYDVAGRLRATQGQEQSTQGKMTVSVYDDMDRVVRTGELTLSGYSESQLRSYFLASSNNDSPDESTPGFVELARYYYDEMPDRSSIQTATGADLYPSGMSTSSFQWSKDRLSAVVAFMPAVVDDPNAAGIYSVAYQYDRYGHVLRTVTFNSLVGTALLQQQQATNAYDLGGRLLKSTRYPNGSSTPTASQVVETYTYDNQGRVSRVQSNGSTLAQYSYSPTGGVSRVLLGGVLEQTQWPHILGGPEHLQTVRTDDQSHALFLEALAYEDCGSGALSNCTPQYGGNLARVGRVWQLATIDRSTDMQYQYDDLNRLTSAVGNGDNTQDGAFGYDVQGRLSWQRRGANATNTTGGEYHYEAGTNRLIWVSAGMDPNSTRDFGDATSPALDYNADGDLVDDESKLMSVVYDHRHLATEYILDNSDGTMTTVQNRYDASGNRVSRLVYKSTWDNTTNTWGSAILQHAKHYTGLGSEIRETGSSSTSTVVMTLPQGLGRYTPGSNTSYEWYLKDHLGSTALVYRTGGSAGLGAQAAYDYQPYGKQISLMEPIDEVTERFTGKELDEEVGLNYFGARYYDADLGVWISVDPMRQFASPYLYAGNGTNPVNAIDGGGNQLKNVTKAAGHVKEIREIERQIEEAEAAQDYERAAELEQQRMALVGKTGEDLGKASLETMKKLAKGPKGAAKDIGKDAVKDVLVEYKDRVFSWVKGLFTDKPSSTNDVGQQAVDDYYKKIEEDPEATWEPEQ